MVYKEIAFSSYYSYCAFVLVKNKISDLHAKYEGGRGGGTVPEGNLRGKPSHLASTMGIRLVGRRNHKMARIWQSLHGTIV